MKISVIIPNYNHNGYLEQRIASVLNQTYKNFEIILLDDASTDHSSHLLKTYENHPKVSYVIYNKTNSGSVFKQWIKGIELASGDYVWIAESDDFADKLFLESTVQILEKHRSAGLVFTDTYKVDAQGNKISLVSKSKKQLKALGDTEGIINKENFVDYLLTRMVIVNASSVLFRKSALLQVDLDMLKDLKNTGDVFVYVGIVLNHDLHYLPTPLNYMRLHADSTTKRNKKSGIIYRDKLLLLDYYLEHFSNLKLEKNSVVSFLYHQFFFAIDHGHSSLLKKILNRFWLLGYINRKDHIISRFIMATYSGLSYQGRPHFIREQLKSFLFKSIR